MKQLAVILFCLLLCNPSFGQDKALKLTRNGKEVLINENKRVIIRTNDDRKIIGNMAFDDNSVIINREHFALTDIKEIRRNPMLATLITSGTLIYIGAATVGIAAIAGLFADPVAFLMVIPGAVMIYAGAKSPVFTRRFLREKGWDFKLVDIN